MPSLNAPPTQQLLTELGELWLQARISEGVVARDTIGKYRTDLLAWRGLEELTLQSCVAHAATWSVAVSTSRRRWRTLRAMLSFAGQHASLVDADAAEILEFSPRPSSQGPNGVRLNISSGDLDVLMAGLAGLWDASVRIGSPVEQAVFLCLWRAGLSPREIICLEPGAIDQPGSRLWLSGRRARCVQVRPQILVKLQAASSNVDGAGSMKLLRYSYGPNRMDLSARWIKAHMGRLCEVAGVPPVIFPQTRIVAVAEMLGSGSKPGEVAAHFGCDVRAIAGIPPRTIRWADPVLTLPELS